MIQNLEQHYKVLGLEPGASLEEVNQAYKDLVFIWHPDRLPQEDERLIKKSVEKLQQINEARDSLRSYHRQFKNKTTTHKAKTEPQPRPAQTTYYRDTPPAGNYQKERYYTTNRQQSYTSPGYQPPRSKQPSQAWNYRDYYTSGNNSNKTNVNGTDGYRDFREAEKSYTPVQQSVSSTPKKPYHKDLRGADLSRSNFKERDFSGRDLSGANLSYADLSDTFLHKIILEEANLQGANLKGANLLQANLRNANLKEANLIGADLSGSDLSGADLTGAKVGFNNKVMVKITAVKLTGAILPDGSIHP